MGVVVGAPVFAVATARLPRKATLVALACLFVLGNLLCALAPDYGLLMAARVITALAHGTFFGIGSVVAAGLVPPNRRSQAIALMFTGLTLANVLGVPMGRIIGEHFGWRMTFAAIVVIALGAVAALVALLPRQIEMQRGNILREFSVLADRRVLLGARHQRPDLGQPVLRLHLHRAAADSGQRLLERGRGTGPAAAGRRADDRQHHRRPPRRPAAGALDAGGAGAQRGGAGAAALRAAAEGADGAADAAVDHALVRTGALAADADRAAGERGAEPRLDPEPGRVQSRQRRRRLDRQRHAGRGAPLAGLPWAGAAISLGALALAAWSSRLGDREALLQTA